MIKNIFFDFDGVIADSVGVKTEAFRKLYEGYGVEVADKVVEHHLLNGGMSRFEKFKLYHNEFLGVEINEGEVQELASRFSEMVMLGVINALEVNGSHDFLREFKNKLQMFIITGTPTDESKIICKERGIIDCFKGIYGSPQKKGYWCKYLLETNELQADETIFVGDAMADYMAAKENNLEFFLRYNEENSEIFKNINDTINFNDFIEFRKKINI